MTIHDKCASLYNRLCDECTEPPVAGKQGTFATVELQSGTVLLYFFCKRCADAGIPKIKQEVERFAMHLLFERALSILRLAEKETAH